MKILKIFFLLVVLGMNYSCATLFNQPLNLSKINCTIMGSYKLDNNLLFTKVIYYPFKDHKLQNKPYFGKFIGNAYFVNFDQPGDYILGSIEGFYKGNQIIVRFYNTYLESDNPDEVKSIKSGQVLFNGSFYVENNRGNQIFSNNILLTFSKDNDVTINDVVNRIDKWIIYNKLDVSYVKWINDIKNKINN